MKTFILGKKGTWDRRRGHSFVARTRPSTDAERPGPKIQWHLRRLEPCRTRCLLPLRGRKGGRKGISRDGVAIIIDALTTPTTMKKIQSRMIAKLTRAITGNFLSCQRKASR